jgi:hypothetical protein
MCMGCQSVLTGKFEKTREQLLAGDDDVDEYAVPCAECSEREGRLVMVPVAVLTGAQVGDALDGVDEAAPDDAPPFLPTDTPLEPLDHDQEG